MLSDRNKNIIRNGLGPLVKILAKKKKMAAFFLCPGSLSETDIKIIK